MSTTRGNQPYQYSYNLGSDHNYHSPDPPPPLLYPAYRYGHTHDSPFINAANVISSFGSSSMNGNRKHGLEDRDLPVARSREKKVRSVTDNPPPPLVPAQSMPPVTTTTSDERGVAHPCWADCQRQQALLFGHLQMLQFSITDSVTNKDGQKNKESNEIKKLKTQLFDNLCTALLAVNEVMGDAISSLNQSIQSTDQLRKLQKICKQTSCWGSLLKDGKLSEEIKKKNDEDEDLVIDEDIVILGGKKPRDIDLLCPISRKPFTQPMINQSPKPCSHRIDKSSLNVFFNAPRCSLGLVSCPIPGCNGRWGLIYTCLESNKTHDQLPTNENVTSSSSLNSESQPKNGNAHNAQRGPSYTSSMIPNTNTAPPLSISPRSRDIWWPFPRRFVNYNPGGGGNHPEDRANQWIRLQLPKCQVVYVDDFTGRVSEIFTGNLLVLIEYEDMTDPQDMRIYLQDERDRHLVKRIYIEKLLNSSRNQISFNGFITPYKAVSFHDSFPSHDKHGKWYRKNCYLMEMLGTPSNLYSENIYDQHQVEAYRGNPNLMPYYSFLELCRQIAQYP